MPDSWFGSAVCGYFGSGSGAYPIPKETGAGQPKGAELTHSNIRSNIESIGDLFTPTEEDVFFGGLPLFHVFGQTVAMNASIKTGAELTLLPRFDPAKHSQKITGCDLLAGHPNAG